MKLSSKEIKESIAIQLSERLKKDGFFYKKGNNEFVSNKGNFSYIFNMLLTAWNDHYSLSVRLYISQKEIEQVYERILGKSHKLTIGNTIERILKSPDGREVVNADMSIIIFQTDDIEAAAETLEKYYTDIAKPYFEKYQTLYAVNEIINNPPFDYCPAYVGGNFDERCMKGLIAARLVNNENYQKLVTKYDEVIKETRSIDSIENYNKVKEYLAFNRI